jgi:hypothetical protein
VWWLLCVAAGLSAAAADDVLTRLLTLLVGCTGTWEDDIGCDITGRVSVNCQQPCHLCTCCCLTSGNLQCLGCAAFIAINGA